MTDKDGFVKGFPLPQCGLDHPHGAVVSVTYTRGLKAVLFHRGSWYEHQDGSYRQWIGCLDKNGDWVTECITPKMLDGFVDMAFGDD